MTRVESSTSIGEPESPASPDHSGSGGDTLTVAELCRRVDDTIRDAFADEVWIKGAISGLSRSGNGHVYFDLVDPTDELGSTTAAVLPVALFASTRHLVNKILRKAGGMRMHDGIEIRIRGKVAYYPPQGRVQLIMSLIDPQFTLGQMAAAKATLLEKLADQDLLDRNQQIPFPPLPLRVALVTSDGSAAFADFVKQIEQSGHPFRITLLDSRVQGMEAVPSLTAAIRACDDLDVDVVAVVRGGGSRTDLAAFDHERVAVAIARSRHPVVVGVGHEIDRSVADEVANVSAKTPTATAAVLVEAVDEFSARVDGAAGRLASLTALHMGAAKDHLLGCGARLTTAARRAVDLQEWQLGHVSHRLQRVPPQHLELASHRLVAGAARLDALDPQRALQRGWSITRTDAGELVRSTAQVAPGTGLSTTTMDGTILSEVVSVAPQGPTEPEDPTGDER